MVNISEQILAQLEQRIEIEEGRIIDCQDITSEALETIRQCKALLAEWRRT